MRTQEACLDAHTTPQVEQYDYGEVLRIATASPPRMRTASDSAARLAHEEYIHPYGHDACNTNTNYEGAHTNDRAESSRDATSHVHGQRRVPETTPPLRTHAVRALETSSHVRGPMTPPGDPNSGMSCVAANVCHMYVHIRMHAYIHATYILICIHIYLHKCTYYDMHLYVVRMQTYIVECTRVIYTCTYMYASC